MFYNHRQRRAPSVFLKKLLLLDFDVIEDDYAENSGSL
jgi:hypothetical protein